MVLGALLMLALGFWAMGGAGEGRDELAAIAPGEERAALIEASRGPLERAPRDPVPANMPTRVDARTESTSSAAEREMVRSRSTDVVGEHVITGRVFDPEGMPASDAQVYIVSRLRATDSSAWGHVAARTDAGGQYRIEGNRPGRFTLSARHATHGSGVERDLRVEANKSNEVEAPDIHLIRGGSIVGSVVDAEQQPIEGANVRLHGWLKENVTADASGGFELHDLPAGRYTVVIDAQGYLQERREEVSSGTYAVRIELTRRIAVEVTVLDEQTLEPIPDYRAEVWTSDSRNGSLGRRVGGRRYALDEQGRTSIENLDMGSFVVRVEAEGYARAQTPSFVLRPGAASPKLELLVTPGGELVGVVTNEHTGAPIYNAVVKLEHPGENGLWMEFDAVRSKADGAYRFKHLSIGAHRLGVDHPDYAVHHEDILIASSAARPATRDVRLMPGATLEVSVRHAEGHLVPREVHLRGEGIDRRLGSNSGARHGFPYKFDQLPPGRYRVAVLEDVEIAVELDLELGEHREQDLPLAP